MKLLSDYQPQALALLRIVSAVLFIEHGTAAIFGFPHTTRAMPPLVSMLGLAGELELIGGPLLLMGLFTRPVAFVMSGLMAAAYWIAHAPRGTYPVANGGDAAILFCFIFLFLVCAGPGAWSLDGHRGRAAERGRAVTDGRLRAEARE